MHDLESHSPQSDGELIDLIYAALLGEAAWQDFVGRLATAMPEGRTVLFFHDARKFRGSYSLTAGFDDAAVAAQSTPGNIAESCDSPITGSTSDCSSS